MRPHCSLTLLAASVGLAALSCAAADSPPAASDQTPAAQLTRGEDVYFADCAMCHNDDLSGGAMHSAPPLAGQPFLARWSGRSALELLTLARTTMPEGEPRSLDDQSYLDVIAFVLARNKIALGAGALTEQSAAQIALR